MSRRLQKLASMNPRLVSEKVVEQTLDQRLGSCGFRAIRVSQARSTQQTPGIPDRRYVHREAGLALWWEVKKPGGIWSAAQQEFAEDCHRTGELYFIGGVDEMYSLLRVIGCFDGLVLRPQGWRSKRSPSRHGELLGEKAFDLPRLAALIRLYWRLTPADRRKTPWPQWLQNLAPDAQP